MRDKNIAIFEETMGICKRGSYKMGDKKVYLKLSSADMARAIALSTDMSQELMDNAINIGTDRTFVMGRTGVYTENSDSFEAAKDIIPSYDRDREDSRSILVLNFANPVHPGGMESFHSLWSASFPYAIGDGKTLPVGNSDGTASISNSTYNL